MGDDVLPVSRLIILKKITGIKHPSSGEERLAHNQEVGRSKLLDANRANSLVVELLSSKESTWVHFAHFLY